MQHAVIRAAEPHGLPLNVFILPELLGDLGYVSHAVTDIWNNDGNLKGGQMAPGSSYRRPHPKQANIYSLDFDCLLWFSRRGFSSHLGYWAGKEDYFDHSNQNKELSFFHVILHLMHCTAFLSLSVCLWYPNNTHIGHVMFLTILPPSFQTEVF